MKNILFALIIFYPFIIWGQLSNYYNYKTLDANNITINLNNVGDLGIVNDRYGAKWNQIKAKNYFDSVIVYDQGLWVIGKINNFPHLGIVEWVVYPYSSYSPGPIINNLPAMLIDPKDSVKYRVYKISGGDDNSNPDYADWPGDLGAPVDSSGNPQIYGDQTTWTVYNALDSTLRYRQLWNQYYDTLPVMPVEIQQLAFSRIGNSPDSIDIFSNVVFFEWTIINKGKYEIDSCYISLWTDIDFWDFFYNLPGVDTCFQTGYCWGNTGKEWEDPVVGYVLLYGPTVPAKGDSAVLKVKQLEMQKI